MADTPLSVNPTRAARALAHARGVPLPDRRFHELFEERVRQHPDATAVRQREIAWSYDQLNRQANRVAHLLLADGLRAEDVVAVVSERTPTWAAAVLGVFKAGGVYLPIDPAYPAERMATLMRQSASRFALYAPEVADPVAAASGAAGASSRLHPLDPPMEARREDNPGTPVSARQAAYIYFTSGSTGVPKGAVCEHLGMLNHLLAKVEVLELGADDVVVQNAPVAFDISLWQLAAVLLVGGRVELVPTEAVLNVRQFVDWIVSAGATVLQLVPSYLDVMLADVEARPRPLGLLRRVSVTGEAINVPLVERWFERFPHIALVNAYGATEASDDTTHAVLRRAPGMPLVPVGRPIHNARVYVVDERLQLVPPGSTGEIVFAGICVGRGYINDPERTREAFVDDPYLPGERMYRSGDFGRWLPDGNLEFLGRRDEQVKIRGMRVEVGEVEHRIQRLDGVAQAAVVVRDTGHGKSLVAFYTPESAPPGEPTLTSERLLAVLRDTLPAHLIPVACHRLDAVPLTENGKTDKRTLAALAAGTPDGPTVCGPPPTTAAERRLAVAWAEVLGRPLDAMTATDDFFALGGDSLAAVRLVVKLDRAVSLADLLRHPVLRDLATLVDGDRQRVDRRLLQPLAEPDHADAVLVCVPDAGGNAVNFRQLAGLLAPSGVAAYAVELPAHDVADRRPLAAVVDVARRVAAELLAQPAVPLAVWGQGAGAATALAIARELELAGAPARRVFVAANAIDSGAAAESSIAKAGRLTDDEVKSSLATHAGFVELDELRHERARVVGAAYRHDVVSGARHLAAALGNPAQYGVAAALTVVVAQDDPATARRQAGLDRWRALAGEVSQVVLPRGGHHFHRTEPASCADLVLRHVAAVAPRAGPPGSSRKPSRGRSA
jgi:amino acid adenylation domain-containing protein